MERTRKITIPLIIGGLVLIVTIGAGVNFLITNNQGQNQSNNNQSNVKNPPTSSQSNTENDTNEPSSENLSYKDGTYTANGKYNSPGGLEGINVTVVIQDNLIQSVSTEHVTTNRTSTQYYNLFERGIAGVVVGKNIETKFSPRNINGSSLTIIGFDKALEEIREKAAI